MDKHVFHGDKTCFNACKADIKVTMKYKDDKVVASDESHHSCKNTPRQSHFYEWVDSLLVGPGKCVFQKDYWRWKCPQMVVFKIY